MATKLPNQGLAFWPVGCGDSTTVCIAPEVLMQVDLHNLECADDDDDARTPIIDELIPLLPKRAGKPYLPLFVLTHPDKDHCCGFAELNSRVTIGELWFSPRIFREYKKDLSDDALAFRDEAKRRVAKTIEVGDLPESGHRVRLIGYDDLLKEDQFKGFPSELVTPPGNPLTVIDGVNYAGSFSAFIHAPFKDDCAGPRNDASIGIQVEFTDRDASGHALLLGDLCYPTIKKILTITQEKNDGRMDWDVFLAPHHCSKSVMYFQDEGDKEAVLKQDILDLLSDARKDGAYVVASSEPVPSSNKPGDNPPHTKAKARYEEIVEANHFLCTMEHGSIKAPERITFSLGDKGLTYGGVSEKEDGSAKSLALETVVAAARGTSQPPADRVGFGRH